MMKSNKEINRENTGSTKIFDDRTVETDYRTLIPFLKDGMRVLDIGCGTGAISKGIAHCVGETGHVTGIDNTERFIVSGIETYHDIKNLTLIHADLFEYHTTEKFDLIVAARVLQWLSNPKQALLKMKTILKPGGYVSILDYNHEAIEWKPEPPASMIKFYQTFLRWRSDAGMNNRIADDLPNYFSEVGFKSIEVLNSNETYTRERKDFITKAGIWSKVAGSKQMVEEGYISDNDRLKAIEDYNDWVNDEAQLMVMKLNEVRGCI